jgi:hypothetical protein
MKVRFVAVGVIFTSLQATLPLPAQQTHTVIVYTTGFGSATEGDRDSSMGEATQNATNQANAVCAGNVTNTVTTSSGCIKGGPDGNGNYTYSCTASVKDTCEMQYRGK